MPDVFSTGALAFGVGIEDTFIAEEAPGQRKLDEYELTQHYAQWKDDLRLAADSGARFIRWGIPWYRVEAQPGRFDFSWIDEVAGLASSLGLEVVVDLLHYGTPLWLDNSFLNTGYADEFAEYAGEVAARYHGVFRHYTPSNEPMVNALRCGRDGLWPPHLRGDDGLVKVVGALSRGMSQAIEAIRSADHESRIVHVDAGFRWTGERFPGMSRPELEEWRFLATDLVTGRMTEESPLYGYLVENGVSPMMIRWHHDHPQSIDVMGVNYYPANSTVAFDEDGEEVFVDEGAEGLKDLLRAYWNRYGLPLAVTETSRNESDRAKQLWLGESVAALAQLRSDGVPVVGYTWFPLFSLVDWNYRENTAEMDACWNHLGLVNLERDASNTLRRVPTDAFPLYRSIASGS